MISEAFGELARHDPPRSRREDSVPKEPKIDEVSTAKEEEDEEDEVRCHTF